MIDGLSLEEARELLGEEAVGKTDAELMAILQALDDFARVVVDVFMTRKAKGLSVTFDNQGRLTDPPAREAEL